MASRRTTMAKTIIMKKPALGFSKQECCSLILSPRAAPPEKKVSGDAGSASEEKKKCRLVDYHSLPTFLKHNEFILSYYRSEWPLKETILSIFSIHNETLNVWTHLMGFFIFLTLALSAAAMVPADSALYRAQVPAIANSSQSHQVQQKLTILLATSYLNASSLTELEMSSHASSAAMASRWPFYAYLGGAMFCLLMSSACHLLSCHSEHTNYVMLRLDYSGITGLIVTSFYPLVYYSFQCHPFFLNLYISFITVFGAATILVSLIPAFETPEFRPLRTGLFICMAISGLVPIIHKAMLFGDRPEAVLTTGYETIMGVFYALGVIVYATRVPERWMPGRFDLAGHSHQLFHVLVIAGAYTHYLAGVVYLRWRDSEGC